MRIAIIMVKVLRAFFTFGSRKTGTPLLMASTPVMAVHPFANAFTSSHRLTVVMAGPHFGIAATGSGWPPCNTVLIRPMTITPPRHATKT